MKWYEMNCKNKRGLSHQKMYTSICIICMYVYKYYLYIYTHMMLTYQVQNKRCWPPTWMTNLGIWWPDSSRGRRFLVNFAILYPRIPRPLVELVCLLMNHNTTCFKLDPTHAKQSCSVSFFVSDDHYMNTMIMKVETWN